MTEHDSYTFETAQPRFQTLNDYVGWVAEDWVHTFGSDEAQLHVRSKLGEEVYELSEALDNGTPEDIKLELGDVLWTANAVALNEGFTPSSEPISLEDLDKQAKVADIEWDVPVLRALYGLSSEEVKTKIASGDPETTQMALSSLAGQLGKAGRMTRAMTPYTDNSPSKERTFSDGWLEVQHGRVISAVGQINLLVSLIAQNRLGVGLSEVMQANYDKISERLATGKPVTK
ncbi:MAG: MazG nucleotide pyrophosphohydrolase domain-containing protein [Candidatus Saccharimonadales bacterium]